MCPAEPALKFVVEPTFRLSRTAIMTLTSQVKIGSKLIELPTAKQLKQEIALKEAEKAKLAMRDRGAADAEKQALLEKLSKPSGVSDDERLERALVIIKRAASNGSTEVEVTRFPNSLCTDRGRAINQQEPGWESTLTGVPKELFEFWHKYLRPNGFKLRVRITDFPGGIPGDIGMSLSWA
jgi:hypothetical protein